MNNYSRSYTRLITLLFGVATLLLVGCATPPPPKIAVTPDIEQSNGIKIEDARPPTEGKSKTFSLMITSSGYGIWRMADMTDGPTGIRLLTHRAYETFPELATAPVIKINHFVTYVNLKSQLRKMAAGGVIGGAIGALVVGANSATSTPATDGVHTTLIDSAYFAETARKEHTRAFYTEAENPERVPVNLFFIETELLGRKIATRSLFVPPSDNKLTLIEVVDIVVKNHLNFYKNREGSLIPENQSAVAAPKTTP
jgi:hypothetical protein